MFQSLKISTPAIFGLFLAGFASASPEDSILWQQQNRGIQTLWTVHFTDSLHGWAGGDAWTLYRTVDGGANWTRLPQLGSDTIYALFFHDDTVGWAATGSGRIYRTGDGGNSWTQSHYRAGWLTGLFFHGRDTGFTCGSARRGTANIYDPVIWRTLNRGQTWDSVGIRSGPYSLASIRSPDRRNIFVTGFNYLIRSRDGGNTFPTPVYFPSISDTQFSNNAGYINVLDFPTPARGFAVGRYGHLIGTVDSGASWRTVMLNNFIWWEDIRFAGPAKGIIAGERGAVRSTADSGATWTLRYPRHPSSLNAPWFRELHVVNENNVWMVGDSALIMKGAFAAAPGTGISRFTRRSGAGFSFRLDPASGGKMRFRFSLAEAGRVELILSDVQGRGLKRTVLGLQPPGNREFSWNLGFVPAPGIYSVRIRVNGVDAEASRIVILR